MCERYITGTSNKRLTNIQSVLPTALKDASDDALIESNPLYRWKYEIKQAPKHGRSSNTAAIRRTEICSRSRSDLACALPNRAPCSGPQRSRPCKRRKRSPT